MRLNWEHLEYLSLVLPTYLLKVDNQNICSASIHCQNTKAKQPESGDLRGNITEFGVAEGSPEPAGQR